MCKHTKSSNKKIDVCMVNLIKALNSSDHKVLACCCGHGKYPMTIIVKSYGNIFELISGKAIFRKSRFYVKDKDGLYYVPEVFK